MNPEGTPLKSLSQTKHNTPRSAGMLALKVNIISIKANTSVLGCIANVNNADVSGNGTLEVITAIHFLRYLPPLFLMGIVRWKLRKRQELTQGSGEVCIYPAIRRFCNDGVPCVQAQNSIYTGYSHFYFEHINICFLHDNTLLLDREMTVNCKLYCTITHGMFVIL